MEFRFKDEYGEYTESFRNVFEAQFFARANNIEFLGMAPMEKVAV